MRGRKPKQESRGTEICTRLTEWKRLPKSERQSLRSLACELNTSHQLLGHYLKQWHKWEAKQCWRRARAIRAQADAEGRRIRPWEEQQAVSWDREAIRVMLMPTLVKEFERIKQDAERGPLHPAEFKILKIYAREGFAGAQELTEKCLRNGLKKRKPFAEIVRETPRRDGETLQLWVRRIWDRCEDYDTKCPTSLTEELLEKLSHDSAKHPKNNLPVVTAGDPKSFKFENGSLATPLNVDGGRGDDSHAVT